MNGNDGVALEALDLSAGYGRQPVLRGLNLRVAAGEIYALLGGNGAGKSTTLNAFLGLLPPRSGRIGVCGIDVAADPLAARARLAYVPENVVLYEHLTARENLRYFLGLIDPGLARGETIDAALSAAGLEPSSWGRRLAGYSKGMRQKVAIALALARSAPVLLLDEPDTGLDPRANGELNRLLTDLRGEGKTVFMVTHDLLGAAQVADRIGFLSEGRIVDEFAAAGPERFDVDALYRRYAGWSAQR
ncbi:ABC transporter ATP-binding protein [Noviherbaspirillum aridicola]|uniref:ABC transporter ATP-binding protein n=1 Tax=Noviherbaspirillum aridicola TaxID=2849687 RepID=A0ABQ4Q7X7_9BURK|nr:ABC transporter ATP-binding protein [Noviherbaspirillum aridicola]GIZ53318.1 ABC transporter ATP-binding protein [Noviherbaspirillum aridicola]